MSALHVNLSNSTTFAVSLIGFTTGLLITSLLLVLTLRASKLPGTPRANIVFALCGMLWSLGGLVHTGLLAAGQPLHSFSVLASQALQYTGAAAFPIPILAIWRPFAVRAPGRRRRRAILRDRVVDLGGGDRGVALARAAFRSPRIWHLTAYNATLFIVLGAAISLRRDSTCAASTDPRSRS